MLIGATENESRTAYIAFQRLEMAGHKLYPISIKTGAINGKPFTKHQDYKFQEPIHTITLYINSSIQNEMEDFILKVNPKRIIFNPGTENPTLLHKANLAGIETIEDCTLVMLTRNTF